MGRMRALFCVSCRDQSPERDTTDGIDVSHLATPHNSTSLSHQAGTPLSRISPVICNDRSDSCDDDRSRYLQQHSDQNNAGLSEPQRRSSPVSREIPNSNRREGLEEILNAQPPPIQPQENNPNQQAAPAQPVYNNYEQQNGQHAPLNQYHPVSRGTEQGNANGQLARHPANNLNHQPQHPAASINGTSAKLSYDIISVREPLAKILADRQSSQHRQLVGDHEYIEVYGERGSSCFYEEIAGSTTSSATYDQIGNASNHNYQALINAYAVAHGPAEANRGPENNDISENYSISNHVSDPTNTNENIYDVTQPSNGRNASEQSNQDHLQPSTSLNHTNQHLIGTQDSQMATTSSQPPIPSERNSVLTQSIPVYSVINKATRRSSIMTRMNFDNNRPPQPPPKNLINAYNQTSKSAIQSYEEPSQLLQSTQNHSSNRKSFDTSTSSFVAMRDENNTSNSPQPPPRMSKRNTFNATNRPLPLPEDLDQNHDTNAMTSREHNDNDANSVNNGYELLDNQFDDDQIDVGYEKIRESNRYSGGSLASQFRPLQALDNGGYESVQPIYSSPSNALAEPNYEAIGPATASELAAAATARLNAAATVIERFQANQFLKQDQ